MTSMTESVTWKGELKNGLYITVGTALIGFGVVLFLAPNKVATGGTPGMAILLHYLTGLSIGTLMLAVNIPLLLIGMKYLGKRFGIRTVISIFLTSGFVDLFNLVLRLKPASNELLLASLFGGVVIGIGVGLVLRGNSSAGGSTIIARLAADRFGIKPGQTILAVDMLIIVSSALVFNGIEPSLWSLISIYVTSRCIDMVLTGAPSEKVVHIASNRVDSLAPLLTEHLGPHGTILSGSGLQKGQTKTMIFVVVEARRITLLRDLIHQNDPDAFMVVMEASEMLGRGH